MPQVRVLSPRPDSTVCSQSACRFLLPARSFTRTRTCFQSRREPRPHPTGACFESCHLDLVAVDVVSLAATFSKSLLTHFVTAPLPTRPAALGSHWIPKRYAVNLHAAFYCLHSLSSGLEPAFNRAASRSRTQRVRASSPVTSTSYGSNPTCRTLHSNV